MAMKPTDQEIGELYREAGPSGPSAELDRNILMAARAAAENKAEATTWWSRWHLPLQAVTTICLVVMVTILVERQEPLPPALPPLAMNDNGAAADKQQVAPATSSPAPAAAESVAAAPMAKREAAAAPSAKGRMAADQAMAPKDWLDSIQVLINQNRLEEARKRLAAFVQVYPNEVVPEGIRAKLKAAPDGDPSKQP